MVSIFLQYDQVVQRENLDLFVLKLKYKKINVSWFNLFSFKKYTFTAMGC